MIKSKNQHSYKNNEIKLFRKLNSPKKIQDYLNSIPFNFDERSDSCLSPRKVLEKNKARPDAGVGADDRRRDELVVLAPGVGGLDGLGSGI